MNGQSGKHEISGPKGLLSVIGIQAAVVVFTLSSVCSKMAGSHTGSIELFGRTIRGLSRTGYMWLFLELLCLGVYAILWQQIIKKYDLSIAYANRAFAIFWTALWSVVIFGESLRPAWVIGILLVFCGIFTVNSDVK